MAQSCSNCEYYDSSYKGGYCDKKRCEQASGGYCSSWK